MQRIWIIGPTGSGKTTLGKSLGEHLHLTATDLDELNWLPDWKSVPDEELVNVVDGITAQHSWIISGNYNITQKFLARADTLIWLDYPFPTVFRQLLKRTLRRVGTGELCCNGNRETLRKVLSRDSIILWLFRTYKKRKRIGRATISNPNNAHMEICHFKNPRQTAKWLQTLKSE